MTRCTSPKGHSDIFFFFFLYFEQNNILCFHLTLFPHGDSGVMLTKIQFIFMQLTDVAIQPEIKQPKNMLVIIFSHELSLPRFHAAGIQPCHQIMSTNTLETVNRRNSASHFSY